MELSNFQLVDVVGTGPLDWVAVAIVDVETGILWWRKTIQREITLPFGCRWRFTDTGRFTPTDQAEQHRRVLEAKERKEIWHITPKP